MTQPVEQAALDRRSESEKEYGKYTATEVIYLGGARAFNPGDPVPISHVEGYDQPVVEDDGKGNRVLSGKTERVAGVVSESQVAKRGTKAAAAAETKG